ncbi:hypothetical protein GCM10027347_17530 [Larkinella harenae]
MNQLLEYGLLVQESGAITGIEIEISDSPLLAAGTKRRVRLKKLLFDVDLEITAIFELRVFDADDQDLFELYNTDTTLAPSASRERLSRVQPIEIPRTTRDSFRDPQTGAVVLWDAPNAIPEIVFFQSLALAHLQAQGLPLDGSEPYLVVLYLMLANIIREKDALGEF